MPRRKQKYPEKPWHPDPVKWKKHLEKKGPLKIEPSIKPDKGWQLWDWRTLEDRPQ